MKNVWLIKSKIENNTCQNQSEWASCEEYEWVLMLCDHLEIVLSIAEVYWKSIKLTRANWSSTTSAIHCKYLIHLICINQSLIFQNFERISFSLLFSTSFGILFRYIAQERKDIKKISRTNNRLKKSDGAIISQVNTRIHQAIIPQIGSDDSISGRVLSASKGENSSSINIHKTILSCVIQIEMKKIKSRKNIFGKLMKTHTQDIMNIEKTDSHIRNLSLCHSFINNQKIRDQNITKIDISI